mgnify:CR=1 FL=1
MELRELPEPGFELDNLSWPQRPGPGRRQVGLAPTGGGAGPGVGAGTGAGAVCAGGAGGVVSLARSVTLPLALERPRISWLIARIISFSRVSL